MTEGHEPSSDIADEGVRDDDPGVSDREALKPRDNWEELEADGLEGRGDNEEAIQILRELDEDVNDTSANPVEHPEDVVPEGAIEEASEDETYDIHEEPSTGPQRYGEEDEDEVESTEEGQPEGGPGSEEEVLKLHGGVLSTFDFVLASASILAFLGTIVALKWDSWLAGAAEESIGTKQLFVIVVGAIVTVVLAGATVLKMLKKKPQAT